jgi:hypothetical protein
VLVLARGQLGRRLLLVLDELPPLVDGLQPHLADEVKAGGGPELVELQIRHLAER